MTETTQWRGLHNHNRHFYSPGYGNRCGKCSGGYCHPDTPCRCCLAAEVEALRAREQAVRDVIEAELERHTLTNLGDFMFLDQALGRVLRALDGDNDA